MFGCKARVGLASVGIPINEICNLNMEEDIEKIMIQPENNEDNEIRDDNNEIRDEKCLGMLKHLLFQKVFMFLKTLFYSSFELLKKQRFY